MKDDRGELDLTKQIDNLKEQVDGYKALVELQKSQLWELRQSASQLEKTKKLEFQVNQNFIILLEFL